MRIPYCTVRVYNDDTVKLIHVNLRGSATHALSVRVHKVSRVPTKLVAVRSHPSRGAGRAMEHEKTGPDVAQTAFSTHEYAEFGSTEHPTPTSAHTLPHVSVVGMYDNDDYAEECSNEYANVEDSTEKLLKAKSGLDPLADDASGMSWQAAGTMVAAIIVGVAVLGMPQAVSRLGWVLGFIVILLFAGLEVFSGIALTVVFKAASITLNRRPHSFGDLGLAAYGHRGQQIVQYVQFAQLWAYCVVVQYIASKNLTYVIRAAGGGTCTVGTQAMVVLLVLPALQLQRLREAAFLAVFGVATISIVLILYFSQMATETGHSLTDVDIPHSTTATDSLVEIMVIAFAYQGQAVFPEIQSEMKRPADFRKSIIGASIFLTSVYLLVGGFGYGVIGPDAPMLYTWDETKNPSQSRTTAACAFLVAHVLVAYVINASVINQALARRFLPPAPSRLQWLCMTVATECTYFLAANVVPSVTDWMALLSATLGMTLMLTMPAAFALKLRGSLGQLMPHERELYHVILGCSGVLMVATTFAAFYQLSTANWDAAVFQC